MTVSMVVMVVVIAPESDLCFAAAFLKRLWERSVTDQKCTSSYWFSPAHSDIASVLRLGPEGSALWEKLRS